ncbi:RICIN domain-containing protein [Catenulispora sp. NL8]|uniref:RICIN domain-containing protein n=1 Tax=Catenulispora pinistramenti TaxID=2705254 RepID=A0ABS5KNY6_9ACTN|nr:RICIN domain-containing protein [Catenulispora pinistramenti]MBS2547742.1 RICIN domain-containing protein [Catenulispora pinistramenti]
MKIRHTFHTAVLAALVGLLLTLGSAVPAGAAADAAAHTPAAAAQHLAGQASPQTTYGYSIENRAGGAVCVSVVGDHGVALDECEMAGSTWKPIHEITANGLNYYQYQNNGTNYCLGVQGASSDAAPLTEGDCSGTSDHSQFWANSYIDGGFYTFINLHSGKCMGTQGSRTSIGTVVEQGACYTGSGTTQEWYSVTVTS